MYVKTLDLSMALRENARLEEVECKLAGKKSTAGKRACKAEKRAARGSTRKKSGGTTADRRKHSGGI